MPTTSDKSRSERTVLVVGGAGYVGNVLVRRLIHEGFAVRVLVGRVRSGRGDAHSINSEGAKKVFGALRGRGIDRFIFTSTCSNYGLRDSSDPATEEAELAPLSLYAETKVEFEQFVLGEIGAVDFNPVLLRIATAYGISSRMRFDLTISEFTRTLAVGDELEVYDAETWRPYCHVADISKAIVTALEVLLSLRDIRTLQAASPEEGLTVPSRVIFRIEWLPRSAT